jgi:transcription initiation factor IIF auxiliary subunit
MSSPLKIAQDQHYEGNDWWTWSVWIEGAPDALDRVEKVTWHLHPTFPQPVRTLTNRAEKFLLKTAGWGTFMIRAEVTLKTGEVLKLRHELCLTYEDGTPTDA